MSYYMKESIQKHQEGDRAFVRKVTTPPGPQIPQIRGHYFRHPGSKIIPYIIERVPWETIFGTFPNRDRQGSFRTPLGNFLENHGVLLRPRLEPLKILTRAFQITISNNSRDA